MPEIDVIRPKVGEIKITSVIADGRGNWLMDGEIAYTIESEPDPDLNVTITLGFQGAHSPLEAERQTLENLLLIARQFSDLASRELQTVQQRIASRR